MAIKLEFHAIKGILRDLTRSKFSPEFAFDALNIRLTAREGNTLLSVTNEKGTKECILKDSTGETTIEGDYVGHCIINNYLVLFTIPQNGYGNIYRLENKGDYFKVFKLYGGKLNLDTDYPIETLGVYETKEVLKVYWTDNKNPIRSINITKVYQEDADFNLVKSVDGTCRAFVINKLYNSGSFNAGVIQYAISLYSVYNSETAIISLTDLLYCSFEDRGASPEERVDCSFEISINISQNIKKKFDYIRLYSIHRSSINTTPSIKLVTNIPTSSLEYNEAIKLYNTTFIDTGIIGESVDSTLLLYLGGELLLAKTLTSKDLTLFAGNITLLTLVVPESLRENLKDADITFHIGDSIIFDISKLDEVYSYVNSLTKTEEDIKGFKSREVYRFGILFLYKTGKWSEVIFIKDIECPINPVIGNNYILIPKAKITLPDSVINYLKSEQNEYIKMRAVCVYPDFNDRNVICLGVLCPTVFNLLDRQTNSPYVQSSWFTRPILYDSKYVKEYYSLEVSGEEFLKPLHSLEDGEVLYYNHMDSISGDTYYVTSTPKLYSLDVSRGEVQSSESCSVWNQSNINTDYVSTHRSSYFVDTGIVTMYSPEIEFNDSIGYMKDSNYKFRIVGAIKMANTLSDVSITTSTSGFYNSDVGYIGNFKKNKTVNQIISTKFGSGRGLSAAPFWSAQPKVNTGYDLKSLMLWLVYPWHRSGSLMASGVPKDGEKLLWTLKRKIMSNLWFSSNTSYLDTPYIPDNGISPVNSWHSGDSLIRIKAIGNPNTEYYNYYGDIDKVISYDVQNNKKIGIKDREFYGYNIYGGRVVNNKEESVKNVFKYFNKYAYTAIMGISGETFALDGIVDKDAIGVEPVSMKYKSGPHAVFAFNYKNTIIDGLTIPTLLILPNNGNNTNDASDGYGTFLWDTENTTWKLDTIQFDNPTNQAFLWLGELYRDNVINRFGGDTPEAILNNTWEISSKEYLADGNYKSLECWGDTYTQRYDALRTYEYTSEDTNSIVDILSFMCETRVNIDGRYDRNRGNISNLTITPLNFNLINPVYSQRNNYFNYHTLDYNRFSNNYFPNTIVWSKEKHNGEEVDYWTTLNMLSSLDLDGDKGEIESLNTFNNEIYCFLKRGLSNILFNSRVLIPVSDGVPIEMTNGLKVNGKRYISNTIGCSNKWSIAETPAGLYFIDNETNSLYLFNGLIQSLSDKLGFRLWIGENNSHELWDPINYKNFRTYYDKNNDDVYFINDKTCLCYSELLNQFTSFMSYEKVPAMFNINSEFYSFNKGKLWHNFEGDYNMFYGEFKPYSITVVANLDEPYDKIFNTVEFRADSWNGDVLINNATFDTLEVWNEYLYGKSTLATVLGHPSALKKKFRIWRANVPRDTSNHRDRIRNTWAYVKLSMNTPNTWRTEFHDMNIHYFI